MGNKTKAYRGFEQKEISIKMWAKMVMKTGLIVWGCYSVVFVMFAQQIMPKLCHPEVLQYIKIWFSALGHGVLNWGWSKATVDWIDGSKVTIRYVMDNINGLAWLKKVSAHYGFWLGAAEAVGIPLGVLYFWWEDRKNSQPEHRRGAKILKPKQLARQIKKKYGKGDIPLSQEITLSKSLETRHVFTVGGTGTGKTTMLLNVIQKLRERGEKVVIFDLKGDFCSIFYNKDTDIILNPLDQRTAKWTIFNDLINQKAARDLARSFVPRAHGSETSQFFHEAAKTLLSAIFAILAKDRATATNKKVYEIMTLPLTKMKKFFEQHPEGAVAVSYIEKPDSQQAVGVKATLMEFAEVFEDLRNIDGDFSLRKWIRENGPGFLFLTMPPQYKEVIAPALSAAINILMQEMLSLPDSLERRRFFIIDELGALNKLPALISGLTLGRSKGCSIWLGIQDFGRVDKIYGKQTRETIWNNSTSKVILRVDSPDTAKYLSESIGQAEIEESTQSHSMGVKDGRDGMSLGRQVHLRHAMLASEIQAIPDLTAAVKIAGLDPGYPCRIERKKIESANAPAFLEMDQEDQTWPEVELEEKPDQGEQYEPEWLNEEPEEQEIQEELPQDDPKLDAELMKKIKEKEAEDDGQDNDEPEKPNKPDDAGDTGDKPESLITF